jgi:phosphate transport system permease protein
VELRLLKDRWARAAFLALAAACCLLVLGMLAGLCFKAAPLLRRQSLFSILTTLEWQPLQGRFGMLAFVVGTVAVTGLAMVMAVPVSLLTAIYLAEYAPRRVRQAVLPVIDLLTGIPSVIFGVWGVLVVVPGVERLSRCFGLYSSGYSLLAGAAVLTVMVCPFIIHLAHEVIASVPAGIRDASLALGATRWETVKHVVLRRALPGITAAVVLGFSRAFGETIAVLMVAGNVPQVPHSLFDPVYPLPALLANNYGEMMSIPLYDSAMMLSALVLLVVVVLFNGLARLSLRLMPEGAE